MLIDIPLRLEIPQEKLKTMVSESSNGEDYQVMKTKVSAKDRCKLQSRNNATLQFHLHTRYSVKPVAIRNGKAEQEMKNKTVTHYYQLTNIGPSVSNEPYHFSIATPAMLDANVKGEPESSINCTKESVQGINNNDNERMLLRNVMGSTKCAQIDLKVDSTKAGPTDFSRHDCVIGQGWSKDDPYHVLIKMEFNTNMVPTTESENGKEELPDIFVLPTFLGTKTVCVVEKTELISAELGELRAIKRLWPAFLGASIALIICIIGIAVLYKTGVLNKLRIFNRRNEQNPSY